jgi:hypothetical protein
MVGLFIQLLLINYCLTFVKRVFILLSEKLNQGERKMQPPKNTSTNPNQPHLHLSKQQPLEVQPN